LADFNFGFRFEWPQQSVLQASGAGCRMAQIYDRKEGVLFGSGGDVFQ